jgi:hypothetical protein
VTTPAPTSADYPDRADWPIVVGGCHRTGTSLVRRLLDAHSRIHCGPEVPFFREFYGDYRDDPLAHLRFATAARSVLPENDLLDLLGHAFIEIHMQAARRQGKARWADKAPENVLYLSGWARLLGEDWLFVHVVRSPLDTIASMKERPFPLTLPPDLGGRVALYRRCAEAGLEFGATNADRCRFVVYEELVAEPERVVAELMAWLGETFERAQLGFNDVPHQEGLEATKDMWPRFDPEGRFWSTE